MPSVAFACGWLWTRVCLCLVRGPDVHGDLGEKQQSSDAKGTSVFYSDKLVVGGEQLSFTTTVFWLAARTFLRTKGSFSCFLSLPLFNQAQQLKTESTFFV